MSIGRYPNTDANTIMRGGERVLKALRRGNRVIEVSAELFEQIATATAGGSVQVAWPPTDEDGFTTPVVRTEAK